MHVIHSSFHFNDDEWQLVNNYCSFCKSSICKLSNHLTLLGDKKNIPERVNRLFTPGSADKTSERDCGINTTLGQHR